MSGLPLAHALLKYTNLYIRFGLGRSFDPGQPVWRAYLAGLEDTRDACAWTHDFHLAHASRPLVPPSAVAKFGCFSYALIGGGRIRLHFQNAETDGHAPLGSERRERRLADLAELFGHVKQTRPHPLQVIGGSWLYNLDAYRRLFPRSYVATPRVVHGRFQHFSLWGQFLDRQGGIRPRAAGELLERLGRQASVDTLDQCFHLSVLAVEAPVQAFYEFYGVE